MAAAVLTLSDVPHELLQHILSFLPVRALCAASRVARTWHALADADPLWHALCLRRWKRKPGAHLLDEVFFRANLRHPQTLASLTAHELKLVLRKRGLHTTYFEKTDLQQAVVSSTPPDAYPHLIPGKWKASYAAAERDARRQHITREELTAVKWTVYFRRQEGGYMLAFTARFNPDYTYHSDDGNSFPWRFYGSNNQVQVGEFPPIAARRVGRDWSWRLENGFAKLAPIDIAIDVNNDDA